MTPQQRLRAVEKKLGNKPCWACKGFGNQENPRAPNARDLEEIYFPKSFSLHASDELLIDRRKRLEEVKYALRKDRDMPCQLCSGSGVDIAPYSLEHILQALNRAHPSRGIEDSYGISGSGCFLRLGPYGCYYSCKLWWKFGYGLTYHQSPELIEWLDTVLTPKP